MPTVNSQNGFSELASKDVITLDANYPHSSQRWRYYVGGNREFIRYGNSTGFSAGDGFKTITTSGGTTHTYKTAQRFNHTARYESEACMSFKLEQPLSTGEKAVVGYGDPDLENGMANADGWFVEFEPETANDECYLAVYENGTITTNGGSRKKVELNSPSTDWQRFGIRIFSGGPEKIELFENSPAVARVPGRGYRKVGSVSSSNSKAIQSTTNKQVTFSVKGSGAALSISGAGFEKIASNVGEASRVKQVGFFDVPVNTTGTYVPIASARQHPSKSSVIGGLLDMRISHFNSEANVEVIAKEFDPQNVTYGGGDSWSYRAGLTEDETTVQFRNDVDQIVDETGAAQSTTNSPGGNLVARSVDIVSTSGGGGPNATITENISGANGTARNFFLSGDVGVVLCKVTATGNLSLEFIYKENW